MPTRLGEIVSDCVNAARVRVFSNPRSHTSYCTDMRPASISTRQRCDYVTTEVGPTTATKSCKLQGCATPTHMSFRLLLIQMKYDNVRIWSELETFTSAIAARVGKGRVA